MENEKRIIELLAESLYKFDQMIDEHKAIVTGLKGMITEQKETNSRLGKLESEVVKLNLQNTENTRATIKLANEVENIAHLHERVTKLEKTVYK
jgi:ubiquinone biosynthesis protein UbiJ